MKKLIQLLALMVLTLCCNAQTQSINLSQILPQILSQGIVVPQLLPDSLSPLLPSLLPASTQTKVLILYDNPIGESYEKLGFAYAIMLRNLLGHFDGKVDMQATQNYVGGSLENYQATFYLGSAYDFPVPATLLADIAATAKTVVWFKYNIWQLAWDPAYNFTTQKGLTFSSLRGFDSLPSPANPNPGFFDGVIYKGKTLIKYYSYDAASGAVFADPDVGVMQIVDTGKAKVVTQIQDSKTGELVPYITKAGNFWYFADLPLSYIGPRDRYLVLADILHDILNIKHAENHRAMVRLEDVSATVSVASMKKLSNYLYNNSIPFSIATIPYYLDPLGFYTGGKPVQVPMSQAGNLKKSLNYATARGGEIVMHGYTHQYDSTPNSVSAVSGDDYEFWNIVSNTPVAEDSTAWALGRLRSGLHQLFSNGYVPLAWEAPHYQSSPLSIKAVPQLFDTTYQRIVYYTSDIPNLTAATGRDFAVGQFFPYLINQDYYGQRVLPENLGNIEYGNGGPASTTNVIYTWQDLRTNADFAEVVRDGFASFFFHPFLLEPAANEPGLADFKSIISAITGMGYQWTSPSALRHQRH